MSIESDINDQIAQQLRMKLRVEDIRNDLKSILEMADLFILNSDEAIALCNSAKDNLNDIPEFQRIFARVTPINKETETIVLDLQRRLQELIKKLD